MRAVDHHAAGPTRQHATPATPAAPDAAVELQAMVGIIGGMRCAPDRGAALKLLKDAIRHLGADAAMFTSYVQDDLRVSSIRCLLACDPVWAQQYAKHGWCEDDPWLRYARYNAEPILASGLPELDARQRWVVEGAAHFGFRSVLVVPAPTTAAQSRVNVLCLGSSDEDFFTGPRFETLRMWGRLLADELRDCLHRQLRDELIRGARISRDDLLLLRHQQQGHSSKTIAAALGTEPRTIDCRFHRLSLKLGVCNRRAALRIAEIYALI
jgi:hypothetical protein